MKSPPITLLFLLPILLGSTPHQNSLSPVECRENLVTENNEAMSDTLVIEIGSRQFTATLLDNPTATVFKKMLPLTMDMTELNGNEKYFDLARNLPANASNPGEISTGDLLLYGSKTLVLFYKTFSTSYSYTRLGRIDDPDGLVEALGTGNVVVTIKVK